jgi:hypothetical protein
LMEVIRRLGDGEIPFSALSGGSAPEGAPGAVAPWGKLWFDQQRAVALEWMNGAVDIARRPTSEQAPLWRDWEASHVQVMASPLGRYTAMLPLLLVPAISSASTAFSRVQCELGTSAILLAAERHRKKTRAWPASTAAIDGGILPNAPGDPFSRRPYRMVHDQGQLVVYSIGPNRRDERGVYDPKRGPNAGEDDIGARAWDVSLRAKKVQPAGAGP